MRIRRGIALLLTGCLLISLTGCQLAREEADAQADRMIGALVTMESLELFDSAGYLMDHAGQINANGDIEIDGRDARYQGRLYAARDADGLYYFEGVEGSCILVGQNLLYDDTSYGDDVACMECQQGSWFDDVNKGYVHRDDGEALTAEATVWLKPEEQTVILYVNPVYQSADGSVYAMEGMGTAFDFLQNVQDGATMVECKESYAVTRDGQKRTMEAAIRVTFGVKRPAERVVVLQMSADNRIVGRQTYAPAELPEKIAPAADAAYLLIENSTRGTEGNEAVERTAYNRSDDFMKVFVDGGRVCIPQVIELNWK